VETPFIMFPAFSYPPNLIRISASYSICLQYIQSTSIFAHTILYFLKKLFVLRQVYKWPQNKYCSCFGSVAEPHNCDAAPAPTLTPFHGLFSAKLGRFDVAPAPVS
jgi:hypothetical protein